jgi:hypothetical protein
MKRAFFTGVQFVLFFVTFAAGSFLPPFHLRQVLSTSSEGTREFMWDGVLLMLAVFVLIVLVEAVQRRLRTAAPWTALALVLAGVVGLVLKLGFLTVPL